MLFSSSDIWKLQFSERESEILITHKIMKKQK